MPRVPVAGFVGGSDVLRSWDVNREDTINLILESTQPGNAKAPVYLLKIPGVRPFATVPGGQSSVRGLFSQDGHAFVVAGTTFAEFFEDGSFGPQIYVIEDSHPATMISNGQEGANGGQVLVNSGGSGIIYEIQTLSQAPISAPSLVLPYSMGLYIDTYGVVVKANSPEFNFSDPNDLSTFPSLNFAARSEGSDNISAMVRNHRELVILGTRTSEVWFDDGVTPFTPIPGVFIEKGCIATFSALEVDNTVVWLGQGMEGAGMVFRLNGYTPERLSTPAIEFILAESDRLDDAIAWTMELSGHLFYFLFIPDLAWTLVYDFSVQRWTKWARWNTDLGIWQPWFGRCHCYAFGKHLIGDRGSGTIYEVTFDQLTNAVGP